MRWTRRQKSEDRWVRALHQALNDDPKRPVDSWVSELLLARGLRTYSEAMAFFQPAKEPLHDPFLMADMHLAVSRVEEALNHEEGILVFGDYDVDGTTAVALLHSYLESRGARVAFYIPDRYKEGYGLSKRGIDFASDNEFSLMIALDCGIKSIDEVAYAQSLGIDMIIGDHHLPGKEIPDAKAVLDPKRKDCHYPFKELCGCGIAFKLAQALEHSAGRGLERLQSYLDLVAVAIGADMVSIKGENRTLASLGIQQIKACPRPGFAALLKGKPAHSIHLTDLNFSVAPKINAAGRMEHGSLAVSLLLAKDIQEALDQVQAIEEFNRARRATDTVVCEEALSLIERDNESEKMTTVVFQPHWHKGVIGIVASKLQSIYYRPTIVFTQNGSFLAASARSIKNLDIHEALSACSHHLIQFGGHAHAAGLTLLPENYQAFKDTFESVVAASLLLEDLEQEITYEMECTHDWINERNFRIINRFRPFGPDNPEPVFRINGVFLTDAYLMGADRKHLKASLGGVEVVGFHMSEYLEIVTKHRVDLLFVMDQNHYRGVTKFQLRLKDLKKSQEN